MRAIALGTCAFLTTVCMAAMFKLGFSGHLDINWGPVLKIEYYNANPLLTFFGVAGGIICAASLPPLLDRMLYAIRGRGLIPKKV